MMRHLMAEFDRQNTGGGCMGSTWCSCVKRDLSNLMMVDKARLVYAYLCDDFNSIKKLVKSDQEAFLLSLFDPDNHGGTKAHLDVEYWPMMVKAYAVFEREINKVFVRYKKSKQLQHGTANSRATPKIEQQVKYA